LERQLRALAGKWTTFYGATQVIWRSRCMIAGT
jgi:hypothetical protein